MMLILLAALVMQPFALSQAAVGDPRVAQERPAPSDRDLQRIAMEGWAAARDLAPKGGSVGGTGRARRARVAARACA